MLIDVMMILISGFKRKVPSSTVEYRGNINVSLQMIGIFQFMDVCVGARVVKER